jgi:DNA polymerase (family 10)
MSAPTPRQALAALLWDLADLEAASATRRSFRAKAYAHAVWALDDAAPRLDDPPEILLGIPGIGAGVLALIEEFRATGTLERVGRLRSTLPASARELSRLPRMTPARLRWLKTELGVDRPSDLIEAVRAGLLADLPGVGPVTALLWEKRLQESLANGEMPVYRADLYARRWAGHIEAHTGGDVTVTGAIRRLDEWVGRCELLVVGATEVAGFLAGSALVRHSAIEGDRHTLDTLGGALVVNQAAPSNAGTELLVTTGPRHYVETLKGRTSELPRRPSEHDLYKTLAVPYIPPPARATAPHDPDRLLMREHVRGDLHTHTTWSPDGRQTMGSAIEAALEAGLVYLAITDHAVGLRFGGLAIDDLARQREDIIEMRERHPDITIFHGAELNIGRDGSLDYDDDVLAELDFRLAAVHSFFDLDQAEQTERLLTAIANPLVHVIGHLTGRRIGARPPIRLDMAVVCEAAAEASVALEVNGHLDRLDLSATNCRLAAAGGALFTTGSDTHRSGELHNLDNAVGVLQRAGVDPDQVVSSWTVDRVRQWLVGRRAPAG